MTRLTASSKTEKRKAQEEKILRTCRRSLTTYKRIMYRRYLQAAHLDYLDHILEEVSRYVETGGKEGIGRVIIEMPPRHGKTLTVSRLYPTWHLGRNPDHRIMLVSYGASLSYKNSRVARNLIRQPRYRAIFKHELARDSASVETWELHEQEGGCDALGFDGSATGKGAHVLIIDDPVKNRQEAEKENQREKIWDAYKDDLETRLEPGGAVIVLMTRWHQDDLAGRLLKNEADDWVELRLPALAEENDPIGRAYGEALWPERYNRARLEKTRDTRTSYSWLSVFQQQPTASEGGLFKRDNFIKINYVDPLEIAEVVRFWDLAMSSRTSADYTVGVKMARYHNGRLVVLDVQRDQIEWDEVPAFMAKVAIEDGAGVIIGFEQAGYMSRAGKALVGDTRLHGHSIFGYPKDTDKLTNALPFAARVGLKIVDVVDTYWTEEYLNELCAFNKAKNDDQVDASAGAYEMLGPEEANQGSEIVYAEPYSIGGGSY